MNTNEILFSEPDLGSQVAILKKAKAIRAEYLRSLMVATRNSVVEMFRLHGTKAQNTA